MKETDYLIVGQGLAGTLLSYFLLSENQRVLVIDNNHDKAASNIAAGITNPITGRFYVKSWRVEELIPFATQTYRKMETELGISFFHERNVLRALENPGAENDWLAKTANEGYERYLMKSIDASELEGKIKPIYSFGEITESSTTNIPVLVKKWRTLLQEKELILSEKFDYQQIDLEDTNVRYKNIEAKKIIFCEGYQGSTNPFFSYLPFRLSKGEILIIDLPNANFKKLLKHHIFLVPLGGTRYWVGSFYDRDFVDEQPSEIGKKSLLENLKATLTIPFTVLEHHAGIRPTVNDRRPFLGLHPELPQLGIFNGLGAKGASLGPFFARQMVDFLLHGKELEWEADITKRKKKYFRRVEN